MSPRLASLVPVMPLPEPVDPFAGDPGDPARALPDDEESREPLSPADREGVLDELADLEVHEALLAPHGVRGLVVVCDECPDPHYLDWALLRANLRHVLDRGTVQVHEPAVAPDPDDYVTSDYARGYADASLRLDDEDDAADA